MRWLALPYWICLAAPQESWRAVVETDHYVVRTTGERAHAEALARHMELVYRTYAALLNYSKAPPQKFTIRLYRDHEEYRRHGAGGLALAHYSPKTRELVGSYDPDGMWAIFAHEGMHQFTDLVLPDFQKGVSSGQVPAWYCEGLADCVGNSEARENRLFLATMRGYIAHMRTTVIRTAVREGRTRPFRELLYLDQRGFVSENGRLNYATAWSFVHFLMTAPKIEDPAKQIPSGKHKGKLVLFHNLLAAGRKREEAYAQAFGVARPADWDGWEKEWRVYVRSWPDPLAGTPMEGLSADLENLDKTDGVYVGAIEEGTPCAKAGVRPSDVIVALEGREVRHFGHLIPPLLRRKRGENAVLTVRRGQASVELTLSY